MAPASRLPDATRNRLGDVRGGPGEARSPQSPEVAANVGPTPPRGLTLPLDALVVPACLLLVARDLLLFDPPRVLAWRLLHEDRVAAAVPRWLEPLLPRLPPWLDGDPFALLLAALASTTALLYLWLALTARRRAFLIVLAAALLVVLPTVLFIGMGAAMERPYGHDGGVVQLPLALDKILAGQSPYRADYSRSILGRQARRSEFWAGYGENPVLHHHLYLPGTHVLMLPGYLLSRPLGAGFDPRVVTLLAWAVAALAAARLAGGHGKAAAAVVLLNPLVYWHQVFGANDLLPVSLLLLAVLAAERRRSTLAGALLGLALSTKQLAWPYGPFVLAYLGGGRSLRDLGGAAFWRRLARPLVACAGVFVLTVAPLALLAPRAFWGDIVAFMFGLDGEDRYPLGGTPGFGLANVVLYLGGVSSLRDGAPLGLAYLAIAPLCLLLLRWQMREGGTGAVLAAGSAAFLASLYASRMVHANFLVPAAVLLPIGFLMGVRRPADACVAPLLLLLTAVEVSQHALLRATGQQLIDSWVPERLAGLWAVLGPRAPSLVPDPFGLLWSALLAGLGVLYLIAGLLGARQRARSALVALALAVGVAGPLVFVTLVGATTGVVRAQDPWIGQALAATRGPGASRDRPSGLEAWSMSFRHDPPAALVQGNPDRPAAATIGAVLDRLKLREPRVLSLAAMAAAAVFVVRLVAPPARPLALGALLLSPATAVGAVFGAPEVVLLALIVAAWERVRAGAAFAGGLLAGLATAITPAALPPAFVLLGRARMAALVAGLATGWLALTLPGTLAGALPRGLAIGPAVGLPNVLLYWGSGEAAWTKTVAVVLFLAAAASGLAFRQRVKPAGGAAPVLTLAAGVALFALWAAPRAWPHALALPLGLLALAGAHASLRPHEGQRSRG